MTWLRFRNSACSFRLPIALFLLAAIFAVVLPLGAQNASVQPLSAEQVKAMRAQIRAALFVPEHLPALDPAAHGQFSPVAGVVAERVTYATQYGLRIPAIVYRPEKSHGKLPGIVVVNGHGADKSSWYSWYTGILYAQAGAVVLTYDPMGEPG